MLCYHIHCKSSYMYSQLLKAELIYLAHKHKQLNEWIKFVAGTDVPTPTHSTQK